MKGILTGGSNDRATTRCRLNIGPINLPLRLLHGHEGELVSTRRKTAFYEEFGAGRYQPFGAGPPQNVAVVGKQHRLVKRIVSIEFEGDFTSPIRTKDANFLLSTHGLQQSDSIGGADKLSFECECLRS